MFGSRTYRLPNPHQPGAKMLVTVDLGDYPKFIIVDVSNEDSPIELTEDEQHDVYMELGPIIAGDLADYAMDSMEDR